MDELLARPEFADFWALKWADLLRIDRQALGHKRAYAYYKWVRDGLAADKPYDQFVREVLTADFVRTSRAKGMSETRVVKWRGMRIVRVLILTAIGLQFGALMGQAVVVEKLFSWPGIGSLLVDSVLQRDIPAVQGSILVVVLCFLAINMVIDLLYGVIDPRIRYA